MQVGAARKSGFLKAKERKTSRKIRTADRKAQDAQGQRDCVRFADEEIVGPFCKGEVRKAGGSVAVGADTGVLLPHPCGRTRPYLPMASSCKHLLLSAFGG